MVINAIANYASIAVGVLKMSKSKQVICRYKNGTPVKDDSRVRQRTVRDGKNTYLYIPCRIVGRGREREEKRVLIETEEINR